MLLLHMQIRRYFNKICDNLIYHCVNNKMKNKKYDIVGTFLKSNRSIVERDNIDIPNTNTRPLTVLVWDRHFNKKWRVK